MKTWVFLLFPGSTLGFYVILLIWKYHLIPRWNCSYHLINANLFSGSHCLQLRVLSLLLVLQILIGKQSWLTGEDAAWTLSPTFCWCQWAGWLSWISVLKPERSGCRTRFFSISPVALFTLLQIPLIPLTLPGQQPCGHTSSHPPLWTPEWGVGAGRSMWWGRPARATCL